MKREWDGVLEVIELSLGLLLALSERHTAGLLQFNQPPLKKNDL